MTKLFLSGKHTIRFISYMFILSAWFFDMVPMAAQGNWYWNQTLNTEASLLSGAVVGGEGSIAAIYYNPATITEMGQNNLSLSANIVSLLFIKAENLLGKDFPTDRLQVDIQPRVITYTFTPRKNPQLTLEVAYFMKNKSYFTINQGNSLTDDVILSNPGEEYYTADFYFRSVFQDHNAGLGLGYRFSDSFSLGFSGLLSFKDDRYYNLVTTNAFTTPEQQSGYSRQYLSGAMYQLNYSVYDVRLVTKFGMHWRNNNWSVGANVTLPSLKLFGKGKVIKQYEYSNIHKIQGDPEGFNAYYGGRQNNSIAHFKDPLSIAAGINYYSPSENTVLLFTAEYFFALPDFTYIEALKDPGDEDYDFSFGGSKEWLSFAVRHKAILNAGMAFKRRLNDNLTLYGGFRTDFNSKKTMEESELIDDNNRCMYKFDLYHFNLGAGYADQRGSFTLGMQFTYGYGPNQKQMLNIAAPIEYIDDLHIPLTGLTDNNVFIRYYDISVYFSFIFNFMKNKAG